jgi:hypothetical protein
MHTDSFIGTVDDKVKSTAEFFVARGIGIGEGEVILAQMILEYTRGVANITLQVADNNGLLDS